jgi:hypothetical protein
MVSREDIREGKRQGVSSGGFSHWRKHYQAEKYGIRMSCRPGARVDLFAPLGWRKLQRKKDIKFKMSYRRRMTTTVPRGQTVIRMSCHIAEGWDATQKHKKVKEYFVAFVICDKDELSYRRKRWWRGQSGTRMSCHELSYRFKIRSETRKNKTIDLLAIDLCWLL